MGLVGGVEPEELAARDGDEVIALEGLLRVQPLHGFGLSDGVTQERLGGSEACFAPIRQTAIIFVTALAGAERRIDLEGPLDEGVLEIGPAARILIATCERKQRDRGER